MFMIKKDKNLTKLLVLFLYSIFYINNYFGDTRQHFLLYYCYYYRVVGMMPVSPKYYFYYVKDDCRKGQERL